MRYRPVDENGDMMPVPRISYMLEGADAVGAAVNSRVKLIQGEWWQDEEAGFAIPKILLKSTRVSNNIGLFSSYIGNYITRTEGVQSIINSDLQFDGHDIKFKCDVITKYSSQIKKAEVSGDVIRGSLSR